MINQQSLTDLAPRNPAAMVTVDNQEANFLHGLYFSLLYLIVYSLKLPTDASTIGKAQIEYLLQKKRSALVCVA